MVSQGRDGQGSSVQSSQWENSVDWVKWLPVSEIIRREKARWDKNYCLFTKEGQLQMLKLDVWFRRGGGEVRIPYDFWEALALFSLTHGCSRTLSRANLSSGFFLSSLEIKSRAPKTREGKWKLVSLFLVEFGSRGSLTRRNKARPNDVYVSNALVGFSMWIGFEWGFPYKKFVAKNAKRPQIDLFVMRRSHHHLRGQIIQSSTKSGSSGRGCVNWPTKIGYLKVPLYIQEQVLRFDITMYHLLVECHK